MSCYAGPYNRGIVTKGLVLYYDINEPVCYSSGRTDIQDLSRNGNAGTLVNGVGYSANNGGSLVFDGVNDYGTLPTNLIIHDDGNPFTISVWFKTANNTGVILGQQSSSAVGTGSGYVPSIYVDSSGKLRTSCFWGGAAVNQSVSSTSVNDNTFHQITVTVSGTSHKSYLDSNLYADLTKTQTSYSTTYYYFIGACSQSGWTSVADNALL